MILFFVILSVKVGYQKEKIEEVIKNIEEQNIYCSCHSPIEWEQLSNTSISWLIMDHNIITMERSIILLHKIWRMHHLYLIHIDRVVPRKDYLVFIERINNEFLNHDNIFVISNVKGGGYKHQEIEIEDEMLRTIVSPWPSPREMNYYYRNGILPNDSNTCRLQEWEFAVILSGDSYPIQDVDVIVRRISRYTSTNRLLNSFNNYKTNRRFVHVKHGDRILKVLEFAYRKCGKEAIAQQLNGVFNESINQTNNTIPVVWGEQWVILTRSLVEYSVTSEFARKWYNVLEYAASHSVEGYFQNMVYASCREDFVSVGEKLMYSPWHKGGHGAKLELKPEDIELALKSDAMFARKVWSPDTEQAIENQIVRSRSHEEDYLYYCGQLPRTN